MKTTRVTRSAVINGIAATCDVLVVEPACGNVILVAEVRTDSLYADCRTGRAELLRDAVTLTLRVESDSNGLVFMVDAETHPFLFTDVPFLTADFANSPAEFRRTIKAIAERFAFAAMVYTVESL